jgi:hypothetical protein
VQQKQGQNYTERADDGAQVTKIFGDLQHVIGAGDCVEEGAEFGGILLAWT